MDQSACQFVQAWIGNEIPDSTGEVITYTAPFFHDSFRITFLRLNLWRNLDFQLCSYR